MTNEQVTNATKAKPAVNKINAHRSGGNIIHTDDGGILSDRSGGKWVCPKCFGVFDRDQIFPLKPTSVTAS